jgi:putative lipoprotein
MSQTAGTSEMPLNVSRRAVAKAGLLIAAMAVMPAAAQSSEEMTKARVFGIEWRVAELAGVEPVEGHVPTLTLDETGRAGGNSGCNVYFSTATIKDDGTISFSEIGSTYIACEDAVMEQERAFFEALELTEQYRLDDGGLQLLGSDGALLVRLAAII